MTIKTPTQHEEKRPSRPLTPGEQYAAEFLAEAMDRTDRGWVAEAIDDGQLLVCPSCQFVRLPRNPFSIDAVTTKDHPGIDEASCEVCALVTQSMKFDFTLDMAFALHSAPDDLACQRAARADALYRYWISASNGADALVMNAMRNGIEAAGISVPRVELQTA